MDTARGLGDTPNPELDLTAKPRKECCMADLETKIACPRCGASVTLRLSEMRPGNLKACPACSAPVRFSGTDASKIQEVISQLGAVGPGVSVKVRVKTKRPWWRFWSPS
jgi:hypothetical protein